MKKKLIATVMAATMAVTALTGCGSSSASSAKKDIKVPTKPFGDTVKYDPSVEINDGKDISIDLWEWGSGEAMNYFRRLLTDTQLFILM